MINSDLNEILRDKLYNYEEPVDADIWSGIQTKLARRARMRVVRKVCFYAGAAAAACLIAGLFLFRESDGSITPVTISSSPIIVADKAVSDYAVQDNAEVASESAAAADFPVRNAGNLNLIADGQPSNEDIIPMAEQVKNLENISAEVVTQQENTSSNNQQEIQEASAEVANNIPLGFWDEEEIVAEPKRHKSEISLSSNFASSSTSRGVGTIPMYAPSKLGESAAQTIPTPVEGDNKYYMPLSFGLQLKSRIAGDLSVGIGLNYTYIVTRYDSKINHFLYENTYNQLHYLGIPVNLYYDWSVGKSNLVDLYVFAGGAIEKCLDSRYVYGSNVIHDNVAGFQYSVNAGFGVEYWFVPRVAFYFDPSIAYYFNNNQPMNIRTAQPLQMHAEIGLRFKL